MENASAIRILRADDAETAGRLAAAEGWISENREEFDIFRAHDSEGCLAADENGALAAVCVATSYGGRGFIGEMIVARTARGRGLGPLLFDRAMERLRGLGCLSISLDAVPRAVSFYESRGFRPVVRSLRLLGRIPSSRDAGVRPMASSDLDEIEAIDRRAFGADRSFFLRRRFHDAPELAWVRSDGRALQGYLFGRRNSGFVCAGPWWAAAGDADPAGLLRGFAEGAGDFDIQLGVLESNTRATALFQTLGFRIKPRPALRMVWGEGGTVGGDPSLLAIGTGAKG